MSFNTSYIQADTLNTATSTTIAGHILSNGVDDSLTLGGLSGVMSVTQLNSDVLVTGTMSANTLIPSLGVGYDMALTGNLDMSSYDVKQVKGLATVTNSYGTAGQVLKTDGSGCYWATDSQGDISQWATYNAVQDVDLSGNNLLRVNSMNIGTINAPVGRLQIETGNNLSLNGRKLLDVSAISLINGGYGTAGQVLKTSGSNVSWADDNSGDVSQWATYQAVQDVDMNDKNLSNVAEISSSGTNITTFKSQVQIQNYLDLTSYGITALGSISTTVNGLGTAGQVLKTDGANVSWADDAQADIGQWATYQAVQDVDLSGNNIINVGTISSFGDDITTFTSQVQIQNYLDLTSYGLTALGSISTSANGLGTAGQVLKTDGANVSWADDAQADVGQWAMFKAVQDVDLSGNNIANVSSVECQSTIYQNVAKTEQINVSYGFSKAEPPISALVVEDPNQQYAYISTNGSIEALNSMNTQVFGILNTTDITNDYLGRFSNLGDYTGSYLKTDIINLKRRSNKLLYVSSASSGGVFEDGQVLTPFSTIQKALNYINTNYDGTYYYIQLENGVYSESFTITKPCFIQGLGKSTYEDGVGCQITGTITVNIPTTGNMFNTCFNLSGVLLSGYINNISNGDTCLNLRDVYIYSSNSSIVHNPSGQSRLRIQDCYFNSVNTSSTDPLLDIRSGSYLFMSNTQFNAKGLQSCLSFSGSSNCDTVTNCKFECSSVSASVLPIVLVSGITSATYTFVNCGFLYSSTTDKSSNVAASGIYNSTGTGNNRIVSLYNSFFLLGTNTSNNYAIKDQEYGTAKSMAVIYYMCGASLGNAFSIEAVQNVNKFQLNIVS